MNMTTAALRGELAQLTKHGGIYHVKHDISRYIKTYDQEETLIVILKKLWA